MTRRSTEVFLHTTEASHDPTPVSTAANCDNGFGNTINVMRIVTQCDRAGLAGIQAAVEARTDPDFVVIARTEAFIAGRTKREALERARAYADAGADAVLVHSKSDSFEELREFAAAWDRSSSCVLVAVPTTYEGISAGELFDSGFKVVIFANQALRAAVRAMQDAMVVLRREMRRCRRFMGLLGLKS
ncbi:hypothetical protein ASPACDRAFT_38439 [Aspergillus aculeatus ATCC 16872]|uniref:Phosphoenolpyruvate phosphomutase n=1 Tax=Aspergillus aculeatus (strain ATCC 16872 / CBS 172.66 / WB 5094) TaxID=690307 RepID=A0A1L9X8X6_ASPA1|nr:uncharacterized protein ASPACDRAFT_38439 [Aspergillus aculeatus ATCC 16872]OJK04880.1 hypothetical protein ASPACDRAFT_38439 [Aspergillus aculeatus ATCC 16872]